MTASLRIQTELYNQTKNSQASRGFHSRVKSRPFDSDLDKAFKAFEYLSCLDY